MSTYYVRSKEGYYRILNKGWTDTTRDPNLLIHTAEQVIEFQHKFIELNRPPTLFKQIKNLFWRILGSPIETMGLTQDPAWVIPLEGDNPREDLAIPFYEFKIE